MQKRYLLSKDQEYLAILEYSEANRLLLYRKGLKDIFFEAFRLKHKGTSEYVSQNGRIRVTVAENETYNLLVAKSKTPNVFDAMEMKEIPLSAISKNAFGLSITKRYYTSNFGAYLLISYDRGMVEAYLKNDKTGVYEKETLKFSKSNGHNRYDNVPSKISRQYYIMAYDTEDFAVFVKGSESDFGIGMEEISLTSVKESDEGIRLI